MPELFGFLIIYVPSMVFKGPLNAGKQFVAIILVLLVLSMRFLSEHLSSKTGEKQVTVACLHSGTLFVEEK